MRARFAELLLGNRQTSWPEGWQLADAVGFAAAPLLLQMRESERSSAERRVLLLGAYGLAAGEGADAGIFDVLAERPGWRDRLMALLVLATGPRRGAAPADLWSRLVGRGRPPPVIAVAAYLAASTFELDRVTLPAPDADDPGLVAAARLCGVAVAPRLLQGWLQDTDRDHDELVWRGDLLGGNPAPGTETRALQKLGGRDTDDPVRLAAAIHAAAAIDPATVLSTLGSQRPHGAIVALLAAEPTLRGRLPADWLRPAPSPLDGDCRRLAVLYALRRPIRVVLDQAEAWAREKDFGEHVCLTLAWRILADGGRGTQAIAVPAVLADLPEAAWLRWALDGSAEPTKLADPILDRALELARGGRLPPAAARRVLEESLWRLGSHPGLGRWRAERRLIADLLFAGSFLVAKIAPELRQHERYLPKGISPSDQEFFPAAWDYFEYVSQPRAPVPAALRLRP